jgi:hypothetical protein
VPIALRVCTNIWQKYGVKLFVILHIDAGSYDDGGNGRRR